jgi:hypothetical protein
MDCLAELLKICKQGVFEESATQRLGIGEK